MYASAIALVDEIKIVASARIHVSTGNYINNTVITENFDGSLSVRNIAKNPVSGEYYAAHIEYGTAYNGRGYIYPTESKVLKIPIGRVPFPAHRAGRAPPWSPICRSGQRSAARRSRRAGR